MRRLTLALAATIGLTVGSWGQSGFVGLSSDWVANGYDFSGFGGPIAEMSGWPGGSYDENDEFVPDPNIHTGYWENEEWDSSKWPAGATASVRMGLSYEVIRAPDGNYEVTITASQTDTFGWGGSITAKYGGPSLEDLSLIPGSLELYEIDENTQWWAETPTPIVGTPSIPNTLGLGDVITESLFATVTGYFPTGDGGEPPSPTRYTSPQALTLNLILSNGVFVPAADAEE